jgi:hypothetical protein
MAKTETSTSLAVAEGSTAVAEAALPAFQVETSATDMVLPFLKVIQSQADEVTRGKDKYNENVRPGDIYDSVTRTVYDSPEIIICGIRKYYGEWEGDVRGKLIAKHRVDSPVVTGAQKVERISAKGTPYYDLASASGNRLEETFGVVVIVKNNGISLPATFTLSKSAFAIGKTLNTLLTMYQPAGVPKFKFSTNTKQNEKGSWFVPVFEFAGFEDNADVINMAANINKVVDSIIFSFAAGEVESPIENQDVV